MVISDGFAIEAWLTSNVSLANCLWVFNTSVYSHCRALSDLLLCLWWVSRLYEARLLWLREEVSRASTACQRHLTLSRAPGEADSGRSNARSRRGRASATVPEVRASLKCCVSAEESAEEADRGRCTYLAVLTTRFPRLSEFQGLKYLAPKVRTRAQALMLY